VLCLVSLPIPSRAIDLALPGNARETARSEASPESHALAIGPVENGTLQTLVVEGRVSRAAWRIEAQGITTLQLLQPLRDQLTKAGFTLLFECEASACGGFDFRYQLDVFAEPDMHVDLFDFRYLAARGAAVEGDAEHVAILISRNASAGFIEIAQIVPPGGAAPKATPSGAPTTTGVKVPATSLPLTRQLEDTGHAVLSDLAFETGSSSLGAGTFASLDALAAFLLADPARRIALVGHTDAVGALDNNIALSKRRAASVLERLVKVYNVPRTQLEAGGMGYLSPIASNLTQEGRELNRRVEAVLLNTQ
jgi:OOP family OmpA-OmpF porin